MVDPVEVEELELIKISSSFQTTLLEFWVEALDQSHGLKPWIKTLDQSPGLEPLIKALDRSPGFQTLKSLLT